jgi:glutaredoxin-like YruB-family protein
MEYKNVASLKELNGMLDTHPSAYLLLFKQGAEQSECALKRIREADIPGESILLLANVAEVKEIHPQFGITTAPALLQFVSREVKTIFKGCQTIDFYRAVLSGKKFSTAQVQEGKRQKRVVVYTTPTCTWCTTIKTYFRENNITFTEVDVASNPSKAEEMVRKSGQQGVPQTEIDGKMIVGFDKQRINDLLDIR